MPDSPSPLLYMIGKGNCEFKRSGDVAYRHVGNAPEVEITPELDILEHFSSMAGSRVKDRKVVREKSATLRVVLEEFEANNMALAMMAEPPENNTAGDPVIRILSASEITGAFRFTGTNDVGQQVDVDLPNVSVTPEAGVSLISDEWGRMELTFDILADTNGEFGTMTFREANATA